MSNVEVEPLTWKTLFKDEPEGSFSGLTSDGKSKYFCLRMFDGGFRVYGIDGVNDGGTEFPDDDSESVKNIVQKHWSETVKSYLAEQSVGD